MACRCSFPVLTRTFPVSKSRSLFDDPAERIEELTAIVKQDIQHIRGKIEALHTIVGSQRFQTAQMTEHSGTVIQTLNNNLMQATERFRKVLEVRTEARIFATRNSRRTHSSFFNFTTQNLKSQQERKEKFVGSRRAGALPMLPFNPALEPSVFNPFSFFSCSFRSISPCIETRTEDQRKTTRTFPSRCLSCRREISSCNNDLNLSGLSRAQLTRSKEFSRSSVLSQCSRMK